MLVIHASLAAIAVAKWCRNHREGGDEGGDERGVQWGRLHEISAIKIIIRVCLHAGACILYTHPPCEYARDLETQQESTRSDGAQMD